MPAPSIMVQSSFFSRGDGVTLRHLAEASGAELRQCDDPERRVFGIASLGEAGPDDVSFFDNRRYQVDLGTSAAACIIVKPKFLDLVPTTTPVLVARSVMPVFAMVGRELFPAAVAVSSAIGAVGVSPKAVIDPTARLEANVTVEPFAVIGGDVEIGRGTVIGAHAVIGNGCRIGRDCQIGAGVNIIHSLVGNNVTIHSGARLGQDGFGYVPGPNGLMKAVQIGRVIIQDEVEIGANTTIDRGAIRDTVIGEGTKIDNQVQIAHNTSIGRHCAIAAQVGISGSVVIGDGVMMGGQSGVNSHTTVGEGAQIAGTASVATHVPARGRWGGTPAKPIRQWFRELTALSEFARKMPSQGTDDEH